MDTDTQNHFGCVLYAQKYDLGMNMISRGKSLLEIDVFHPDAILKVKVLLEKKQDLNEQNPVNGNALLHLCAIAGNTQLAAFLLDNGANINLSNAEGYTALHLAAVKSQEKMCLFLLSCKANPLIKSKSQDSVLMTAANRGLTQVVDQLLERKDIEINAINHKGMSALYTATQAGHASIVSKLIESKADLNISVLSETPLHFAVASDQLSLVQVLLNAKGNPNQLYDEGSSLLSTAVLLQNFNIVMELLNKKANPNIESVMSNRALYIAAEKQFVDIAEKLIEYKADTNISSNNGTTALMQAVETKNQNMVALLIKADAKVNSTTTKGVSALQMAASHNHNEIFNLLLEAKADPLQADQKGVSPIHLAVKNNNLVMLRNLVPLQKDLNELTKGNSLLHTAVKHADVNLLEYLLEQKINLNIRNSDGMTPLAMAASLNKIKQVEVLVRKGADTGYKDPFRVVDHAAHNGFTEVVKILYKNDDKAINDFLLDRKITEPRSLSVNEIRQGNPEFAEMMENMLREQATRIMQRALRAKHKKVYKGKYKETLKGKLSVNFLKEPWGSKYKEYADRIKADQWLALDFKHPEVERNLYKALRLELITMSEMVTANLLYHAYRQFFQQKNPLILKKFVYEEGPYSLSEISYGNEEKISYFKLRLKRLPKHEQYYFTANCDRFYEYHFIKRTIELGDSFASPKFLHFLRLFIGKLAVSEDEKYKLYHALDEIEGQNIKSTSATPRQIECVRALGYALHVHYSDVRALPNVDKSAILAAAFFRLEPMNPFIEVSPDYIDSDPESPLLCKIIPSVASFKLLLNVFHDKDASLPFFTVGMFSPAFIRALDETPERFNYSSQMRPVEMFHPDVIGNEYPHDIKASVFETTMHDFTFHCMRNSQLTIKPFVRYLRQLLDLKGLKGLKGYGMSKIIWKLSDFDSGYGIFMRLNKGKEGIRTGYKGVIRILYREDFFSHHNRYDDNLIILFNMLMNPKRWQYYLGEYPYEFMMWASGSEFSAVWERLQSVVARYPDYTFEKGFMFLIIAYRLNGNSQGLAALENLAKEDNSLNQFFKWQRNGGICFKKDYVPFGQTAIEELLPENIAQLCVEVHKRVGENKKSKTEAKPLPKTEVRSSDNQSASTPQTLSVEFRRRSLKR